LNTIYKSDTKFCNTISLGIPLQLKERKDTKIKDHAAKEERGNIASSSKEADKGGDKTTRKRESSQIVSVLFQLGLLKGRRNAARKKEGCS
jgi:hypothetical protein